MEDNVNITLMIGTGQYKRDIQLSQEENMLKDMVLCHLLENLDINMLKN